ncbi:hypothetical protein [Pseudomonas sp. UBA1879]|uniref:hypothetical protein n=1 Tax=Pseudomonas sp. UBA1879 TaxID=1947305 RepID=UPI0025CC707D|nr:hypothetical protein [Pseudomonas sp. UBA1879]
MDEVDWWSRIPAYAGLGLSVFAVFRGRTYLQVSLGNQYDHEEIFVSNMSPHEVEVISLGAINADGSLSDWTDGPQPWRSLPKRIPARGHLTISLDADIAPANLCHAYNLGRGGCFVRITGGKVFSNPGLIKRKWWKVRSLFRPKFSDPLE